MTKTTAVAASLALLLCISIAIFSTRHNDRVTANESENVISISETRVNTFVSSTQGNSCLSTDPNGTVVVWDSRRQQEGTYGVYLQRFGLNGKRIGGEQQVNLFSKNMQLRPAVASDGKSATWIAWESFGQDGSMSGIFARRFQINSDNHSFVGGDEILVNQTTDGMQKDVVVATDLNGNATFVWTTEATEEMPQRIMRRSFDTFGLSLSDEVIVQSTDNNQRLPAIAIDSKNRTMIVWAESDLATNLPTGIFARRFNAEGQPVGQTIQVNPLDNRDHIEPVIVTNGNGFVIGWMRSTDEHYQAVFNQFDPDGTALHEMTVASPKNAMRVSGVCVSATPNNLMVAWNRSVDGAIGRETIIEAAKFSRNGKPIANRFIINQDSQATHHLTSASGKNRMGCDSLGRIHVVWNGNCNEDKSAIGLTVLSSDEASEFAFDYPLPPGIDIGNLESTVETTAKPHDPPVFDPRQRARDRFGGDLLGRSAGSAFGFIGIVNTGWRPPDPTLAVGPNHIIATTNGEIAFFDKEGTLLFQDEIENSFGFWGDLGTTNFVFDPEVLFDPHSNRFFAMCNERGSDGRSYYLLAVSDDDDPTGDWFKYRLDVTDLANDNDIDSPNMSVDENAVYLTADFFGPDKFLVYMLDKAEVMAGVADPADTHILITGTQSYGIATSFDAGAAGMYMIRGDEFATSTTLHLSAIQDALGTPSITTIDIAVPEYGHPVDPMSQGTTTQPELFESRFWSCVYRNGNLWAVHHQSPTTADVARATWYQIDMKNWPDSGDSPVLVQSGEILPDPNTWTYFPSIWVDAHDNAAITFAKSNSGEFISMCRSLRLASDPPGTFRPFEVVRPSADVYSLNRWGDYSGTVDDPAEVGVFWGIHMYSPGSNSWNTWVGKYELPRTDVIVAASKFLDGSIVAGLLSDAEISDDQFVELIPSATQNPFKQIIELIVQGEAPTTSPLDFHFCLESRMIGEDTDDVLQTVSLFNYATGNYEELDDRSASITETGIRVTPPGNLSNYIDPLTAEVTAKVKWQSPSFADTPYLWSIEVDQAIWRFLE